MIKRLPLLLLLLLNASSIAQWIQANGPDRGFVLGFAVISDEGGTTLLAGTRNGVFISANHGDSWTTAESGVDNREVTALVVSPDDKGGRRIFAGTSAGVFLSTDNGKRWARIGLKNVIIVALAVSADKEGGVSLYAAGETGVFRSTSNGASWANIDNGLPAFVIETFVVSPDGANLFVGIAGAGVYRSGDNGDTWTKADFGLPEGGVNSLAFSSDGTNLFAGTREDGVYLSTNNGASWTETGMKKHVITALAVSPDGATVLAGTISGGLFLSSNFGSSWQEFNLTSEVRAFAFAPEPAGGTNFFAGTFGSGVYRSGDNGKSWTPVNIGMFPPAYAYSLAVYPKESGGNTLFVMTDIGLFLSNDDAATWTKSSLNIQVMNFTFFLDETGAANLFAGTSNGVVRFIDNGIDWTAVNTGLANFIAYDFAVSPNKAGGADFFAGTLSGVFRSIDSGASWTAVNSGLSEIDVNALAVYPSNAGGTYLFAGTDGGGVFRSADNGDTWMAVNNGLDSRYFVVYDFAVSPNKTSGTSLFVASNQGVFRTTDNGDSWAAANNGLTKYAILTLAVHTDRAGGIFLFAGSSPDGIYFSADNGDSWKAINDGLDDYHNTVWSLVFCEDENGMTDVFAATEKGVWRRKLSDVIVSVDKHPTAQPPCFSKSRNYPNPFNSTTTIPFTLASACNVSLKIYDLAGREIATLVAEELSAGTHAVQWNAAGAPSGTYFCRIETEVFSETKKLLLLR